MLEGAAGLIERRRPILVDRGGSRLAVDRAPPRAAHRPRVPRPQVTRQGRLCPPDGDQVYVAWDSVALPG